MMALSILPKIVLGAVLLGATGGVVGSFAVLRKRSLLGDTLAHAALPGICLAYLLFASRDLLVLSGGALVAGLLGVLLVTIIPHWTRTREDAALGLVLSTFFGVGIVMLSIIQQRGSSGYAGLDSYLFGEVASLVSRDINRLAAVGVVSLTAVALLFKELKLLCFDEAFAAAQGWPTLLLDVATMSAIALVTIVSLPICGVVLTAAVLIFPCTTARYWSDRLGVVILLSGLLGALAGAGGVLAWQLGGVAGGGLPPGPMIVLSSAALFLASLLLAPRRGLLYRGWLGMRTRVEVITDHILRRMYELTERDLPAMKPVAAKPLTRDLGADPLTWWLVIRTSRARGWLAEPIAGQLQLTETGLREAARVTRAHRLWELFLVAHADIAADHVHRDADDLEHYLPPDLVQSMERELAAAGRLPPGSSTMQVPASPHAVEGTNRVTPDA